MDARTFVRGGYLALCYNYHTDQGLRKRKGNEPLVSATVNGDNPINGVAMYEWDTTRYLLALSAGALKYLNGSSWSTITGSHSFSSTAGHRLQTCHFNDGSNLMILGCNGPSNSRPFLWTGSGNVSQLSGDGAPAYASAMEEFKGHLFCLNVPAGVYSLVYSKYGLVNNWPDLNIIDCDRNSIGMGLARHSEEVLLVFHQKSVHRVVFNYGTSATANLFQNFLVDGSTGLQARSGVITQDGVTYFVGRNEKGITGIYKIDDPTQRAKYISKPIETAWAAMNPARIKEMVAMPLSSREVAFLCSSTTSSVLDQAFVYNTQDDAWSIFNNPNHLLSFNAGCQWVNANGRQVNILAGTNGVVHEAWGDANYDTGNRDGGPTGGSIRALLETGYLDLGYRGVKGLREFWVDVIAGWQISFTGTIYTAADRQVQNQSLSMGTEAGYLGSTFVLGTSRLAATGPAQARAKASRKGRFFKLRLVENSAVEPHVVAGITFAYKQLGTMLN